MKNTFLLNSDICVTEANINYYALPFVHPGRIMDEYDFIYMLDGEWEFGQNDELFTLKKDQILILAPGKFHYGTKPCLPDTKTMYFHVLCKNNALTSERKEIVADTLCDVSLNKNIKRWFTNLVNCKLSGNQMKADAYFGLLMCELTENHLYTSDSGVAAKIKKIIHSNPEKFYTNTELAEMTNVSVKTAENKFKSMYGTTIHQYILNFKIEEAISYFEIFPQITIKETAYNLGFCDEYHFSRQFKKIKGISPLKYIKTHFDERQK